MAVNKGTPTQYYFVRGLVREAEHWQPFLPHFEKNFPGAEKFCLDIPGAGKFFKVKCPPSVSSIVDKMRNEFRVHEDRKASKCLIAMSLGGMIGIEWLKKFPEDFQSAVFINTSVGKMSPTLERLKLTNALGSITKLRKLSIREKEKFVLSLISNNQDRREESLDHWVDIQNKRPISPQNFLRQLVASARFRARRGRPDQPVLLLASSEDRLVDPHCSSRLHDQWHWPLVTHPWAGHDLPLDDPQWVVHQIHQWVSETF